MDIEDLEARVEGNVAVPVSSFEFRGIREEDLKGENAFIRLTYRQAWEAFS